MSRLTVHTPNWWAPERRAKFLAWLNDELTRDEERDVLAIAAAGREPRDVKQARPARAAERNRPKDNS